MYQSIFNLFQTYVYSGLVESGSPEELVCTFFATCACIFMFTLPFTVVYKVIKMVVGY